MAIDGKLHIAVFPWLSFGHMIPYFELAKLMAAKGHRITFISTPRNISRLPQIPPTLKPFFTFLEIHLPKVDNLPEDAEATKDLPDNKIMYLKIACDHLQQPITDFLKTSSPNWIFYDFVMPWVGPIAAQHSVLTAYFSILPAVILGYMGALMYGDEDDKSQEITNLPKLVSFKTSVRPRLYQLRKLREGYKNDSLTLMDVYGHLLGAAINGCDAVVVRSSMDFEPDWLKLMNQVYQKPVVPAGILPAVDSDDSICWTETKEWLDKHEKGTVVYIAFGGEMKLSQSELTQLALGLELSGLPFYWVLINQRGSSDDVVLELPSGFEERTRGRGVVCRSWAPQFKILSHDSVGVLLNHSGMSSVVEGLQLGKPLVLFPFVADQGLIASYLAEKKMAYMLPRDELDGSFTKESVADSLNLVMRKEEGRIYREKAKEMKGIFGSREIQDKCVDELLSFLKKSLK